MALLTGSTRKKEREQLLPAIAEGEMQIVIGTHALIEESVHFQSLGLAIIDEQRMASRAREHGNCAYVPHASSNSSGAYCDLQQDCTLRK